MNIRDVARLADVTPGTVSKVLNNYPDISEATREHVLSIIAQNQYDPKASARARRSSGGPPRLGLVVEGVQNELYGDMEDSLSRNFHNSGYSISAFHDNYYSQDKHEKFRELVAYIRQESLRGLVYLGGCFADLSQEELRTLPCPTIFVNTVLPPAADGDGFSCIQVSHFETAYTQMRMLIDKGHRDICTVISSNVDNSVYGLRVNGYRAALSQSHLEHDFDLFVESDYRMEKCYVRLLPVLRLHPEITAVCCVSDVVVPGIVRALHDAGRSPGQDVDIISFDGLRRLEYSLPSISTFAQPVSEMVRYIDRLMLGLVNDQREHQNITFHPVFQKRESSG